MINNVNNPNEWMKCDYKICKAETLRHKSYWHTLPVNTDELSIVEVEDGKLLAYADVGALEPHSLAYLSQDPNFMDDYNQGKDIYIELARMAFPGKTKEEYKKHYRPLFKTVLLGLQYGMSTPTLANRLGMSIEEAERLSNIFRDRYPKSLELLEYQVEYLKKTGYVYSYLGEKIPVDEFKIENRAEQLGRNYPIQGGSSTLATSGYFMMISKGWELGIDIEPIGMIHDSCQFSFSIKYLFAVEQLFDKYFTQYFLKKTGILYPMEPEFCRNMRDHIEYSRTSDQIDEDIITMEGCIDDINYIINHLIKENYKLALVSDELITKYPDDKLHYECELLSTRPTKKPHIMSIDPGIYKSDIYKVQYKLLTDISNDPIIKKIKDDDLSWVKPIKICKTVKERRDEEVNRINKLK